MLQFDATFYADKDIDALTLIATGLLNQEKRLQAVEQRLLDLSSTQAAARPQQHFNLQDRDHLDIPTRMKYLEEDVEHNRVEADTKLALVRDQLKELQRKETEDIRKVHVELEEDVNLLEKEVNTTFSNAEKDIDTVDGRVDKVKSGVDNNENSYFHLRTGFYALIDFVNSIDYHYEDRVYVIEEQVKEIMKELLAIQRRHEQEDNAANPNVGPVGETGGVQTYPVRVMSKAEKALHDWIEEDKTQYGSDPSPPSAVVESASPIPATFEELLYELKNYNM